MCTGLIAAKVRSINHGLAGNLIRAPQLVRRLRNCPLFTRSSA